MHAVGVGLHRHAGFRLSNTGGGIHALAHIHDADAAYAHRVFILLVTESGDGNAVDPRRVEDRRAGRDRNLPAVDGEVNFGRGPWNSCRPSFR